MRIEKNNPSEGYIDFWDWVTCYWHPVFLLSPAIGYVYYQLTTEEL
jgi:hypothetical protein